MALLGVIYPHLSLALKRNSEVRTDMRILYWSWVLRRTGNMGNEQEQDIYVNKILQSNNISESFMNPDEPG